MCSHWIINGIYCEDGADLIRAVGKRDARKVNGLYDLERPNGSKITEGEIGINCLCHVKVDELERVTGKGDWAYDADQDAMVADLAA